MPKIVKPKKLAIRKLDYSKIQKALPDFDSLDWKIYGSKLAEDDNEQLLLDKKAFITAYQELHYKNDKQNLIEWYDKIKATFVCNKKTVKKNK